jgi:hypothetical protein
LGTPYPAVALDPGGTFYFTEGHEYRIVAVNKDGEELWQVSQASEREAIEPSEIREKVRSLRARYPQASVREADFPRWHPALSQPPADLAADPRAANAAYPLRVDGRGRLYVFPFVSTTEVREHRPVDVYDRNGQLIFAGPMANVQWSAANGDFVYGLVPDSEGNQVVVRYTLIFPTRRPAGVDTCE